MNTQKEKKAFAEADSFMEFKDNNFSDYILPCNGENRLTKEDMQIIECYEKHFNSEPLPKNEVFTALHNGFFDGDLWPAFDFLEAARLGYKIHKKGNTYICKIMVNGFEPDGQPVKMYQLCIASPCLDGFNEYAGMAFAVHQYDEGEQPEIPVF